MSSAVGTRSMTINGTRVCAKNSSMVSMSAVAMDTTSPLRRFRV